MTTKQIQVRAYFDALAIGHSRRSAAQMAGVSVRTAQNLERRHRGMGLPIEAPIFEPDHCCRETSCRRTHPILLRREGKRWYAVTKYVQRVDGSLSIAEKHEVTEQMRAAVEAD